MRRILSRMLCAAALVLGVSMAAGAVDVWKEVRSSEGGFTAVFPADPKIKTEPPDLSGGVANVYLVDLGKTAYEVSYTDYQPGTFAGRSVDAIFNLARDDLVKGQPVKLLADRKITLGDRPGREVVFADQDGYTQVYRFFVVKDRIYAVVAGGPAGSEKSPEAKRFLESFRLVAGK